MCLSACLSVNNITQNVMDRLQWNFIQGSGYTPRAVVIDNNLPILPLISSYVPDWPLPPRVYIPSESEMALRARIYAYNRHLLFDVAFICSTLTHYGVYDLSVWRLKREVSYVHQRVWRWKWFSCQSSYVLQRLRLCRVSDTVFRREIDSQRQWGYGTCYGDSFPAAKECRVWGDKRNKWLNFGGDQDHHADCPIRNSATTQDSSAKL